MPSINVNVFCFNTGNTYAFTNNRIIRDQPLKASVNIYLISFNYPCIRSFFRNLEWTIPAWLLLGAHYFFRISIFWFVGALILWVLGVSVKTIVFSWLVRNGNIPDPPKENKNPYSSTYKPGMKGENKDENI